MLLKQRIDSWNRCLLDMTTKYRRFFLKSRTFRKLPSLNVCSWPLGDKRHCPRRGAQAPAGFRRLASVPVVFFPLVANRAHDDVVADDLEENDVARAAEWNDQFARATIAQFRSAA